MRSPPIWRGTACGAASASAVWLPSRIESVIALLACSRNGYVCCPSLHRDHTIGEVVELMQRTRCVAAVVQPGYGADADKRDLDAALKEVETLRHVYRLAPPTEEAPDAVRRNPPRPKAPASR